MPPLASISTGETGTPFDDERILFPRVDRDEHVLCQVPLSGHMLPWLLKISVDKEGLRAPLLSVSLFLHLCFWSRSRCMLVFLYEHSPPRTLLDDRTLTL